MKKIAIILFFILFLSVVPFSTSAQTEVIYPSLPGVLAPQEIAKTAQTEGEVLPLFMAYLFRLILVVSLLVVVGVVLYAGILYLLSTGNPIRSKIAREWILSAIQGALVIFTSYALLFALDSQLVLFGQRNLEKGDRFEKVDLDWETRNSYFQIPFGLLIEDAILNENAKNKLYDVLDATNEAEAVAEAIYQGSKQLLAIIESCPVGMPCGGGGPASNPGKIPYSPPLPSNRETAASVPPSSGKAQQQAEAEEDFIGSDDLTRGEFTPETPTRSFSLEERTEVKDIIEKIAELEKLRETESGQIYRFLTEELNKLKEKLNNFSPLLVNSVKNEFITDDIIEKISDLYIKQPPNYEREIGKIISEGLAEMNKNIDESKDHGMNYWEKKDADSELLIYKIAINQFIKSQSAKEILEEIASIDRKIKELRELGFNDKGALANERREKTDELKELYKDIKNHPAFEYFYQADKEWGDVRYGTYTVAESACILISAATSINLIHPEVDVMEIVDIAKNGDNLMFNTNIYPVLSEIYNIDISPASSIEDVYKALEDGKTVNIMGHGYPYNTWERTEEDERPINHALVLTGIDKDKGIVYVSDPFFPEKEIMLMEDFKYYISAQIFDTSFIHEVPSMENNKTINFLNDVSDKYSLLSSLTKVKNESINHLLLYFSSLYSSVSVMADEKPAPMVKPGDHNRVNYGSVNHRFIGNVLETIQEGGEFQFSKFDGAAHWQRGVYVKVKEGEIPLADPEKNSLLVPSSEEPGKISEESLEELLEEIQEEETQEEETPQEDLPQEEETPPAALCCPPCPNIAPLVQAKIAEIESYFPIFLEKLEALLQTKEPIKEDLFQLYKAVMIKSLGAKHLMGYNSLLLARRYYEKEEIVIRTDEERTEIGRYYWDWSQWLYNTLYRIETEEKIVEENDPVTFYLQNPLAKKIVEDATLLALGAKEEGIQDAGNLIGVPRKMPPPPPDFGTKFYPPTNPEKTRITSFFGWRYDPFTRARVMHYGVDFAGPRYSPIYAAEKGEVIFAGWMGTQTTGYGVLIAIYHKASEINELSQDAVTYYAHLEPNSLMVKRGDVVSRGQHIAGMGTTGRSTGYHLHYETRIDVSYPYVLHTGTQVNPEEFIDLDYYSFNKNYFLSYKENLLQKIFQSMCIKDVSAQTDLEILYNYLTENNIKIEDLTEEERFEILSFLGISNELAPLLINDALRLPSDFLTCGMEIPVGETFELTWDHLVELLDTIDYYVSEGERLIEQQKLMNELSRPCSCPCAGDCCSCIPPICGGCVLTCDLGAIRAAHNDVAKTRQKLREIAAHIELLTDGHFNTPTEELCDPLNEDIRNDEERILCAGGGSKLITKHELITRKLNYSRSRFDECIARPEQIDDVLSGNRAGRTPFFGPIAEENQFKRYTKTTKNGTLINTSDFNWFCCSDSEEQQ